MLGWQIAHSLTVSVDDQIYYADVAASPDLTFCNICWKSAIEYVLIYFAEAELYNEPDFSGWVRA